MIPGITEDEALPESRVERIPQRHKAVVGDADVVV
jgi:hypothetical protein